MSNEPESVPKSRGWLRVLIALVIAFDVAAFFQWADGAFQSEFGGHPDEAAHYLAGVRVRDAASHFVRRDDSAGEHHPLAALRRTRVFDAMEGAWMLAFGSSRLAVLLFMAALAAVTTTLIFCTVRREFGAWAAVVASLVWLCAPVVRESYETILPGQFFALAWTAAALLAARVIGDRNVQRPAASGGISPAAISGGIVLAIAIAVLVSGFLRESACALGIGVTAFAIAGVALRRRSDSPTGTVWIALIAVVTTVLSVAWMKRSTPDARVLIIATPALAMLAACGAVLLARIVGSPAAIAAENSRRRALWNFLLLLLAVPADLLHPRQKDWSGFGAIALALIEKAPGPSHVLVVSDPSGEGMLLSELAMRDHDKKIIVERATETIVESESAALHGRPFERFLDDEELFAHLTSGRIRFIVLDSAVPQNVRAGYHDQVTRVIEGNVRTFWPIFDTPLIRDGEPQGHPVRIFRVAPSSETQLQLQ